MTFILGSVVGLINFHAREHSIERKLNISMYLKSKILLKLAGRIFLKDCC